MTRIHRHSQAGRRRRGGEIVHTPPSAPQHLPPLVGAHTVPDVAPSAVCHECGHVVRLVRSYWADPVFGVHVGDQVFGAHDPDDGLAHSGRGRGNYVICRGAARLPGATDD